MNRSNLLPNLALVLPLLAAFTLYLACIEGIIDAPENAGIDFVSNQRHIATAFSSVSVLLTLLTGWCAGACRSYAKKRSDLAMLISIAMIALQMRFFW
jgi:hypothetical protein